MTPHIEANKDEIAKIVIMPGDPKRAEFIAQNFLENYKCVNKVRNILAFTGKYNGRRVTVMASGMGNPSMGIYAYELFKEYDVNTIIRVGSMGSFDSNLKLYDVFLVKEIYTTSNYVEIQSNIKDNTFKTNEELNNTVIDMANELGLPITSGTVYCTDVFYEPNMNYQELLNKHNCKGVEMESLSLIHTANILNKKATVILTVSDSFTTNERISAKERQEAFKNMITLALESIIK